jgi:hypothetical protein
MSAKDFQDSILVKTPTTCRNKLYEIGATSSFTEDDGFKTETID